MTRLSPHFTLAEAARSQVAARLNIDNTPPAYVVPALANCATSILEPIRKEFARPFSPSSWYRCPQLNSTIGSRASSQHVKGMAVDLEIAGINNLELFNWIANNLDIDQLILEYHVPYDPSSGWIHVSYINPDKNRNQVFEIKA